jgi:hypothetical protein
VKASINKYGKKARDQKPKGRTDRNWTKLERPRRICSPPQAERQGVTGGAPKAPSASADGVDGQDPREGGFVREVAASVL